MQAMQRVVIVYVCILSVVRATPFDPDSVNQPTPFRYKGKFSNDAFSVGSEYHDDYAIRTFKSGDNSNSIDESDEDKSMQGLTDLFGDLQPCEIFENPPKQGCVLVANGNVHFIRALSDVDIEDVYKALEDAGIPECEVEEDGNNDVPGIGCFWIDEDVESVHLIGVYHPGGMNELDALMNIMEDLEKCEMSGDIPEEGCVLIDERGVHLIHVLTDENIAGVIRALKKLDLKECIFGEDDLRLITTEPCYHIYAFMDTLSFFNIPGTSEGTQDNDDDDGVSPATVQTATGNGLFNRQSLVTKKAKAVLPKKIQSTKQSKEVQRKHGRHGSNGGRVNHRPKWMKYLQTNA